MKIKDAVDEALQAIEEMRRCRVITRAERHLFRRSMDRLRHAIDMVEAEVGEERAETRAP